MQKTVCIFQKRVEKLNQWDPDSINTGISGTQEGIIYSAEELKNLGFKVFVLNNIQNKEKYSNPYANPCYSGYLGKKDFFDFTILHDDVEFAKILRPNTKKLYFLVNGPCQGKIDPTGIELFDDVLWLSAQQKNDWTSKNPTLAKFTKIFGNAVNPTQFKPVQTRANPYSCIYSADYSRGLYILLDIWPNIKRKFPKATLDIYYGLRNWGHMSMGLEQFLRDHIRDLKQLGVTDHGLVGHVELATALSNASMWTYPCIAKETFCITAIKAQLAGAIPVIIEKAALSEMVKFGFKCKAIGEYEDLLLEAMGKIETVSLEERVKMGEFVLEHFTWNKIASKWAALFEI